MTAVATTEDHARRWAERARLDLEAAADRGESGLSKIRTAITERHDEALGYRSLGDYLRTEYADALGNVCRVFGVEFRRQVVAELTEAGLSTRAIAAVTGTSQKTADRDVRFAGESCDSPAPAVNTETGEVSDDYLPNDATGEEVASDAPLPQASEARPRGERGPSHESANGSDVDDAGTTELTPPPAPRPSVVGLDGKTYTKQTPRPRATPRRALPDQFFDAAYDMGKAVERVHRLTEDDRFPQNAEKVAAKHRSDLLRARDLLQQVINSLPTEESSND